MTAEGVFGDSELLAEVGPGPRNGYVASGSERTGNDLEGWTGHLQCVDEELMLRVWRRLLADEEAISKLLSDNFLKDLRPAIDQPLQVPADTNPSFLARALVECSDANRLLPVSEPPSLREGELIRVIGSVSSFRAFLDGWTLRVLGHGSMSFLVRFSKEAFLQARPRGLRGAEVLVLAIVHDARKFELSGIALLVRTTV